MKGRMTCIDNTTGLCRPTGPPDYRTQLTAIREGQAVRPSASGGPLDLRWYGKPSSAFVGAPDVQHNVPGDNLGSRGERND